MANPRSSAAPSARVEVPLPEWTDTPRDTLVLSDGAYARLQDLVMEPAKPNENLVNAVRRSRPK